MHKNDILQLIIASGQELEMLELLQAWVIQGFKQQSYELAEAKAVIRIARKLNKDKSIAGLLEPEEPTKHAKIRRALHD